MHEYFGRINERGASAAVEIKEFREVVTVKYLKQIDNSIYASRGSTCFSPEVHLQFAMVFWFVVPATAICVSTLCVRQCLQTYFCDVPLCIYLWKLDHPTSMCVPKCFVTGGHDWNAVVRFWLTQTHGWQNTDRQIQWTYQLVAQSRPPHRKT